MNTKDEALDLALEALEAALSDDQPYIDKSKQAITAIKQARSAPVREPVAWLIDWPDEPDLGNYFSEEKSDTGRCRPLYTTPPAAQPAPVQEPVNLHQVLTDPENQPNQYGVEFGMHGEKMMFKVGVQQFALNYEPDTQDEFNFMRDMLIHAFSTFTHDVKITPPAAQRQWVGLTDEDIGSAYEEAAAKINYCAPSHVQISRAIEAKLKEKNT